MITTKIRRIMFILIALLSLSGTAIADISYTLNQIPTPPSIYTGDNVFIDLSIRNNNFWFDGYCAVRLDSDSWSDEVRVRAGQTKDYSISVTAPPIGSGSGSIQHTVYSYCYDTSDSTKIYQYTTFTLTYTENPNPLPLSIDANPNTITFGIPTYVTFTVSGGGMVVSGATVTLSGSASGWGITDVNGQVVLSVNPTTIGAIITTASKLGYIDGTTINGLNVIAPTLNLTAITVSPATTSMYIGNTTTFTAIPKDQNGNQMAASLIWSSSNSSVGNINPYTGMFTATAAGTTTITAISGTVSGTASVTVIRQSTASTGTVTRTFSSANVEPGATLTVTLTPSPSYLFAIYQIVETIPAGFTVIANTANGVSNTGNVWTFIQESTAFTYILVAPTTAGTYTFSGTFKDGDRNTGIVSGATQVGVTPITTPIPTPVQTTPPAPPPTPTPTPVPTPLVTPLVTPVPPQSTHTPVPVVSTTPTPTPIPTPTPVVTPIYTPIPTHTPTATPIHTPTQSEGTVTRSFSSVNVAPGETLTVTLTPSPANLFQVYQIYETIPAGFTLTSHTAVDDNGDGSSVGNIWVFTDGLAYGNSFITYTITAPMTIGTYTFSGSFQDEDRNTGLVSGDYTINVISQSTGTVTRSFSSVISTAGNTVTVTLTPAGVVTGGFYQVIETLPAGFTFVSTDANNSAQAGQVITFTTLGGRPFTYIVTARTAGSTQFTGTFIDANRATGNVGGSSVMLVGSLSSGTVTRSKSSLTVPPNGILTITLTPSPLNLFDTPGYRVIETIPAGFTYLNSMAGVAIDGNVITLTQIGSSAITYSLKAPAINDSYAISGIFKDQFTNVGIVGGITSIRVGAGYDFNANGRIERGEAVEAVIEYFNGVITRQEAIDNVIAYFNG